MLLSGNIEITLLTHNMEEMEFSSLEQELEAKAQAEEMFNLAMDANYDILSGNKTLSEFGETGIFFHDPNRYPTSEEADDMISYFESIEEYEKCAHLLKIKQLNEK